MMKGNIISQIGQYTIFMTETLQVGDTSKRFMVKNIINECIKIGYDSLRIVLIISVFTGAVSAVQTAVNLSASYIMDYVIAMVVRDTTFSLIPTLMALVFSGKVGSHISGELGTMQITEQVDALEIMGINSKSFLVFPKMLASLIMFPALIVLALFTALYGGFITVNLFGIISATDYILGIRTDFNEFILVVIMVKALAFALIIPSIASYCGYNTSGGALDVGRSSTLAVTANSIAILAGDFLITQLLV